MIRPSAQLRATIQRTAPPLLILLSAAIIVLGKADQLLFDSLRTALTDDVAPALDVLSRPLAGAASLFDRARGIVMMYQDNLRLEQENARLLQWQQVAAQAVRRQPRTARTAQGRAGQRGLLSHRTRHRQFGRRLCAHRLVNAGTDQGLARGQAAITDRRPRRAADRGRQPRGAGSADYRSQLAHPGRRRTLARPCGAGRRQFRSAAAALSPALRMRSRSATASSPRARAACSRRVCRSASWRRSRAGRGSSLTSSCRSSASVLIVDYGLAGSLPTPAPVAAHSQRQRKPSSANEASVR